MKRGILYFCLVFGAGFILGPIRVLWLVPRVGERAAELIEAPFMLAAILLSARFIVRRFPSQTLSGYLGSGVLALGVLIAAELVVALSLRGLPLREYIGSRDPVAGVVYLGLLALFGVAPWAHARLQSAAQQVASADRSSTQRNRS